MVLDRIYAKLRAESGSHKSLSPFISHSFLSRILLPFWQLSSSEQNSTPHTRLHQSDPTRQLSNMNLVPPAAPVSTPLKEYSRRWSVTEEAHLIYLRDTQYASFDAIAKAMDRSPNAVQNCYRELRQKALAAAITWTPDLDAAIISGRKRHLTCVETAHAMQLAPEAVQERWRYLKANKLVPEDVLAMWQRKEKVEFAEWEDEAILRLWIRGMDDAEIAERLGGGDILVGKRKADIAARRRELTKGSPLYSKMLDVDQGKADASGGLGGKPKYEWQK